MPEQKDYEYPVPDYKRAWYQFTAEEWSGFTPQHWYWFIPIRVPKAILYWAQELFVSWIPPLRRKHAIKRPKHEQGS